MSELGLGLGLGKTYRQFSTQPQQGLIPSQFPWKPNFLVRYNDSTSSYETTYSPSIDKPSGTTKWVDISGGSDSSNSGDTEEDAYRTIDKAVSEGADIIQIKSGHYARSNSWPSSLNPSKNMAFIAAEGPGTVIISRGAEGLSWSSEGSGAYSTNRSNVRTVLDLDATGYAGKTFVDGTSPVPIPLEKVADLAAVQAHDGGAWAQSGSTLYVKTHDSRSPDSDVLPLLIERNTRLVDADVTLYLEGLEIWGDRPLYHHFDTDISNNAKAIAVDCGFRYSGENDNIFIDGIHEARFIRCATSHNLASDDGFNYNRSETVYVPTLTFLEDNCESFANGDSNNDNGSTSHHSKVYGIRVNGDYSDNPGPGVADTAGAQTVNVNCVADNNYIGFQAGTFDDSTPALSYLLDCSASGNSYKDIDRSTGGQVIDLGSNTYSTNNGTIIDGSDTFWLTLSTTAIDAIVGLYSVDNTQFWDNVSGDVNQLNDASPRKYNLTTPAGNIGYNAALSDANDNPVIDFGDSTNSLYLAGQSTLDVQEIILVAQYRDGTQTTFNGTPTIIAGSDSGGSPCIYGDSATADILSSSDFANTVSVNGGSQSSSLLPAPFAIYRFTSSSPQNSTFDLLGTDAYTGRGWQGYVAYALLSNRTLNDAEYNIIRQALESKYGL